MSESANRIASVLKYGVTDCAPRVIARGEGELAKKIIALAQEHDIKIVHNEALAMATMALNIGQEIPEQLYQSVAEILSVIIAERNSVHGS